MALLARSDLRSSHLRRGMYCTGILFVSSPSTLWLGTDTVISIDSPVLLRRLAAVLSKETGLVFVSEYDTGADAQE